MWTIELTFWIRVPKDLGFELLHRMTKCIFRLSVAKTMSFLVNIMRQFTIMTTYYDQKTCPQLMWQQVDRKKLLIPRKERFWALSG